MLYNEGRSKVSLKYWVRSNVDAAAFANTTPHIVRYPQTARPAGAAIPLNVTPCFLLIIHRLFLTACNLSGRMGLVSRG